MTDSNTFIQPLNGGEIIDDLCGIIADKLRNDCNLRDIDGYSSGYKAKVSIHLECYGLDTATVDTDVTVDESSKDAGNELQEPDEVIDAEIEVPQEVDLSLVRERGGQVEPSIEITPEGPVPQRRKYTRRLKALAQAQGGAVGPVEE